MQREMVVGPWEEFWQHYSPWTPLKGDVLQGVSIPERAKLLKKNGWAANIDPAAGPDENTGFKSLEEIASKLEHLEIESRQASYRLVHKPNHVALSTICSGNYMVDGCFYPIHEIPSGPTVALELRRTASANEYKRKGLPKDVYDNRLKVVSAANYAMNENPERMFIYGITIEANMFTLWYFSRSHSAMSKSFDWIKCPRTLVAVLLSFMYATPVELGFDPNIKAYTPTPPDSQYFVYTVNDKKAGTVYFKTLRSLSEYRSLCISGRATRVWKAIQIKFLDDHSPVNGTKEVVLKDIWLQQEAKTERELQTDLFTDVGSFIAGTSPGKPIPQLKLSDARFQEIIQGFLVEERWKKHFLTIMFDGIGVPSKECPKSARPNPTLFNKPLSQPVAPGAQGTDYSRAYSASVLREQTSSASATPPAAPRKFAPKRRYFVVFEELCEAVEDLAGFSDTMNAMKDTVKALVVMWLAGWVHRDISAGDILWFKKDGNEGRGILSDLEYAKKPGDGQASSDPKTGTPFFMALEILDCRLLSGTLESKGKPTFDRDPFESTPPPPRQHVAYNYLHDAESLCWVYLWTLLSRIPHLPSQTLANLIFQNAGLASLTRRTLFLDGIMQQDLDQVHHAVRHLAQMWDRSRTDLLTAFHHPLDKRTDEMYADIYVSLYVLCQRSSETVLAVDLISVQQLAHSTARSRSAPRKRSRAPGDDEDYSPSEDESGGQDLGAKRTQLGKRSQPEDSGSIVSVLLPAKKKRYLEEAVVIYR